MPPRRPPKPPPRNAPRKSNASTPAPAADEGPTLLDQLNYADAPRPFKNANFVSKMPARTASGASAAGFKKNVKQILTLERERVSGGDGFLSAAQTAAKARGEPIEPQKKKKKENPVGRTKVLSGAAAQRARANANRSGFNTPLTIDDESVMSGTVTPAEDEDDKMEIDGLGDEVIHREIITYHTPTAPPSLLPAKKYCDITGLQAAYTDPRTKLRYKGIEVWNIVRNLGPGVDQSYLALRGAQTSLK
ncbi:Chromatin-remodeling complex subunit ies6 [Vanrija pseudolonga]|uniref:Chromatin-remodeling complex subunit ies6 n=1 Tax=Vanrija pseudolonga TaxID=143232 RepID=A0AAF0YAP9_9TREE|nr:Chromatin-remodeling complex subunit ies6 [Vanrija pseudolonga]